MMVQRVHEVLDLEVLGVSSRRLRNPQPFKEPRRSNGAH
jgi:hypothetical protein